MANDRSRHHDEIELKFELDRRAARKVRRHPLLAQADHQTQAQSTVYFDTAKQKLHRKGYSLRVRQAGDCFTQTVKTRGTSAGLFDRREWEAPVDRMEPDPRGLQQAPLADLKNIVRKVRPTVCSDVKRTTWLVDHDGAEIEVVLDSGTVTAGGEDDSFHELELELDKGDPAAILDVAQQLGQAVPLHIGVLSKEERGLMLAEGAFDHEQKASALDVRKDMDAGQVFALAVQECVRHFRLNEPLITTERDALALHQARVAMRRLRTAFTLFGPAIRRGSIEPLKDELRDFIVPFGEARNLDVFLDKHGEDLGWRHRRKLRSSRADAYEQVIDALNAKRTRAMFLDLVAWAASEEWRTNAASTPIRKFAAKRLNSLWRKVNRKGRRLEDLDERQLHRLRITIKKLRYGVEFLGPLYPAKKVRKFASSLEAMQDCLGLVHDDMVTRQIVTDFELGEMVGTDITARSRQLKTTETRYKRLKRANRYWVR